MGEVGMGRLVDDLRAPFPEMKGLSRRNLFLHASLCRRVAGPNCATGCLSALVE